MRSRNHRTAARRCCKRCGRPVATARELARSYDAPDENLCYVTWSRRDLGLRPVQRNMRMTPEVKAMAQDLVLARARERWAACDNAYHLRAAKGLISFIAELPKLRRRR